MGGALAWRPALRLGPSSVPREPCACGGWTGLGGAADRGRDDGGCSPEDGMLDFLLDVKGDVIGLIVCRRLFFIRVTSTNSVTLLLLVFIRFPLFISATSFTN